MKPDKFVELVDKGLNKILRIILSFRKFTPISILYKTLNFLQLGDVYLLEFDKFMYQLYHSKLPQKFYASFSKLSEIHNHNTRNTKLLTYFMPRINTNFSKNFLSYRGFILWGQIAAEFKGMQWILFKKSYKKLLLSLQV